MTKRPLKGAPPRPRPPLGVTALRDRHLTGYGSPEGVVAAGMGTAYQDTDPAGSGAQYKKTTASGKTGWVEIGSGGGATNPYGRFAVYASASLGTFTAGASVHQINFDTVLFDPDGIWYAPWHSIKPLEAGTYYLGAQVYFENSADTWAQLSIRGTDTTVGGFMEGFYPDNAGVYGGVGASHGYIEAHAYAFSDGTDSFGASLGVSANVTVKPPTQFWGWRVSDDNIY